MSINTTIKTDSPNGAGPSGTSSEDAKQAAAGRQATAPAVVSEAAPTMGQAPVSAIDRTVGEATSTMARNNRPRLVLPYGMRWFAKQAREKGIAKALAVTMQRTIDRPLFALRDHLDSARDRRICGMSLEKSELSPFSDSHGAVDSIHSPYGSLEEILGPEEFSKEDVLLDVGCGKGRPLAYLLDTGFPGRLVGVELTPEVATYAQSWSSRFNNVEVIAGDVFDLGLAAYTHYFMFVPMAVKFSRAFIRKIEGEATGRIRLYYLCDMQDGDYIDARPGWEVVRRGWIYRKHGIPLHGIPQRYSVWDFTPQS